MLTGCFWIEERVIVDAASYFHHKGGHLLLGSLVEDPIKPRLGVTDSNRHMTTSIPPPIMDSYHTMESKRDEYLLRRHVSITESEQSNEQIEESGI